MDKKDFRTVLWDINENKIEALPSDFIIRRALSYGTLELIIDIIKKDGLATVKRVFLEMRSSAISAKKYEYLRKYLLT